MSILWSHVITTGIKIRNNVVIKYVYSVHGKNKISAWEIVCLDSAFINLANSTDLSSKKK